MIVSRTPLRMSFVGGGTDMPEFYRKFGGAVLSTAIDKYVYVSINKKFDRGIRVAYSKTEEVQSVAEVEHPIVRHALNELGIEGGVEITTIADIPSRGTGLGSSSSFAVGLINALAAFQGRHMSRDNLGRESCRIEIDLCGEPIGKQDQYAAAFGGMNLIEFMQDERVVVTPILLRPKTREALSRRTIMFYTGITRSASGVLRSQAAEVTASEKKQGMLKRMMRITYDLCDSLQRGDLETLGDALHQNWMLKKELTADISSPDIDQWYEAARSAGAIGGKILGAGAGGFLIFYAPEDKHEAIAAALDPLRRIDFGFDLLGSRIIFYDA